MPIKEYDAAVAEVITETPETKTFQFSMEHMDFRPGQFAMLVVDIPGKGPVSRPYSISSSPLDGMLELTIKKFEGGLMSKYVNENLKKGDKVKIKGPYGMFMLNEQAKKIGFISAGSGIAPFRSMWRYVFQKHMSIDMTLLFSSKTEEYIIFRKELDEIKGMKVVHTLTRNQDPSWKGFARRVDGEMIKAVFPDYKERFFYLCGPPPMCHGAFDELKALSCSEQNIKMEKFD